MTGSQIPARKGGVKFMDVLMIDFNGVLVEDLIPQILRLSLGCANKHLGVSLTKEEARQRLGHNSGGIRKSLTKIFPEAENEKMEDCIKEIYGNLGQLKVRTFPETRKTLRHYRKQGFIISVSSSAPKDLITGWAEKEELLHLFDGILGEERGGKEEHVRLMRQAYKGCRIYYISDSVGEMALGNINIGIAPKGEEVKYYDAGAASVVHYFSETTKKDIRAI